MTLYTKSIFKETSLEDGLRISVMSRHTLNDGKIPDTRITRDKYDKHMPELAPPLKLVGSWYKGRISWAEFELAYLQHIRGPVSLTIEALAVEALTKDITLLCAEETPEYCHRRLLAEECKIYEPSLIIMHK